MRPPLEPPTPAEVRSARDRLPPETRDTPLVRCALAGAPCEPWLKLESLQPTGSFEVRGAAHALAVAPESALARGATTAGAGGPARGLAWSARRLRLPCRVLVPDTAPRAARDAVERLGAELHAVSCDEWWRALIDHEVPLEGHFVHPLADAAAIAGYASVGLEIAAALPEVEAVVAPFGLACGIAAALRDAAPAAAVYACEVETAAPLAASLAAGRPTDLGGAPGLADGLADSLAEPSVLPETWPLARELLAGSIVVSLESAGAAARLLATHARVETGAAGAAALAAALTGAAGRGRVVCVVSAGDLDAEGSAERLARAAEANARGRSPGARPVL